MVGDIAFKNIIPDGKNNWLNQSNPVFDNLIPLADRQSKFARDIDDGQRCIQSVHQCP